MATIIGASMTRIPVWLRIAYHPAVLKRSAILCVLVGTILVVINHGPALVAGAINPTLLVQILLTYLVPFLVSTGTSVAALRASERAHVGLDDRSRDQGSRDA